MLAAAGCNPPPAPPPDAIPLDVVIAGRQLAGAWDWLHFEVADGAMVREREHWRFTATEVRRRLVGFVRRDVLVRSLDGVPFECNQRPRYRQRALIAVTADVGAAGITITERSYDAEPSPCDPGLRRLGEYLGTVDGDRLTLTWDDGEANLNRAAEWTPPDPPPTAPAPAGRWRWEASAWTKAGLVRHEDEDWELAVSETGEVAGSYVRAVTVRSPDNLPLPCAGAPAYAFADRYLVRGKAAEDGWTLDEVAVVPGDHPCLAETPHRTLDAATIRVDGDFLVLSWRGKRRQVLARPFVD